MEDQPVLLVSAHSGRGLEDLHHQLETLAARCPPPLPLTGAFLPIDRSFSLAGTGTVVTGTLQGGPLTTGAEAALWPSGRAVHLRQIQVHGQAVEVAEPGCRVAVNLRGVSAQDVASGEVLCAPGAFASSRLVDAELAVAPDSARPLRHMDEIRVLWGSRHDMAKVALIGAKAIAPGGRGMAQLRFAASVIAFAGQRGVLRRPSPAETIGGLVVLDPAAPPARGHAAARVALLEVVAVGDLSRIADLLAARVGGVLDLAEVARLARREVSQVRADLNADFEDLDLGRLISRAAAAAARAAYLGELTEAHRQSPARAHLAVGAVRSTLARQASRDLIAHVERRLSAEQVIRLTGDRVALADHDPFAALTADAVGRLEQIEVDLRNGGMTPPDAATLTTGQPEDLDLLQLLVDTGRAVSLRNVALRQTLIFHPAALEAAAETLRTVFPPPTEFTTGEARAALATTRKFIVPVLEYLDAQGRTQREGDVRQVVG